MFNGVGSGMGADGSGIEKMQLIFFQPEQNDNGCNSIEGRRVVWGHLLISNRSFRSWEGLTGIN